MNRNKAIIRVSWAGIAANVFLTAIKVAAGLAANSVSILTDAVNSFSDALSSGITIIGAVLSARKPDRAHPFGYGRVEYLSSLFIGVVILYAGFEAAKSSVERILHPQVNDYSTLTLVLVSIAVAVKILLGLYTKKKGTELDSGALKASGKDAIFDSFASAATLVAAVVQMVSGYSIEAWIGIAISAGIIKTGVDTLRESTGIILGKSMDVELAAAVKKAIASFPEVDGVYDIVIHSYGKEKMFGSAHIEVSDRYKVAWIDNLQRAIERKVRKETGVDMLGVSVTAINTQSRDVVVAREAVRKLVAETEGAKELHGFYIDLVDKTMSFVVDAGFGAWSKGTISDELTEKVKEIYPDYNCQILVTYDFTE